MVTLIDQVTSLAMIETAVCPIAFYVSLQEYVVTTPTLDFCDGERKA